MWLSFHSSTQVGKISHIEIGKDPWRKETLISRVVLSFPLVLSLSCWHPETAGSVWVKWCHQGKEKEEAEEEDKNKTPPFPRTPSLVFRPMSRWDMFKSVSWSLRMLAAIVYIISSYTGWDQMLAERFFGVILFHIRFFRDSHFFSRRRRKA